jgi:hypothetical protein
LHLFIESFFIESFHTIRSYKQIGVTLLSKEGSPMKLTSLATFLLATALAASSLPASGADLTGTWKLRFAGPKDNAPKTVGSIVLELKSATDAVTGTAHIGVWPGDAPIADVKVDGDRITFTATGSLGSTTGIPTCQFIATVHGDEMTLTMTAIRNAGGPLGPGVPYEYAGRRQSQ